jgi:hypothetical protein
MICWPGSPRVGNLENNDPEPDRANRRGRVITSESQEKGGNVTRAAALKVRAAETGLKQRFGESRVDLMAYGRTPWS